MSAPIRVLTVAFALLGLQACAPTPPAVAPGGQPIALSPASAGQLDAYLRKVKVTRPGAFAVSPDGQDTFYTWCDDIACVTSDYATPALRGCQSLSGKPCLLLHTRNQQRLAFTRAANGTDGGQHGSQEQRVVDFENR